MMISLLDSFAYSRAADTWLTMLGDVSLKALVILLVACGAQIAWRNGSAAARHLIWSLVLCSVLVLPLLTLALPEWRIAPAWLSAARNQVTRVTQMEAPRVAVARTPETVLALSPLSPLAFEPVILPTVAVRPAVKSALPWN